jgi:hypothetical protein
VAESAATAVVTAPPANTSPPSVSGAAAQGQVLTASPGSWSGYPAPTFSYQWERCSEAGQGCVAIGGATSSTYTAASADVGSTLVVVVMASNEFGSRAAESVPTGVVKAPGGGSSGGSGGSAGGGSAGGADPGGPGASSGGVLGSHESAPSTSQIQTALLSVLVHPGKACRLAWVRRRHGCQVTFDAPAGGEVAISWYLLPKGAHLAAAKPILVASGRAAVMASGELKLTLRLTARGRSLLARGRQLKLTGRGTFTPVGGSTVTVVKSFALR